MAFRTYEEEQHNQLIDETVKSLLDLASALLVSRTDEQLAHHVLPTVSWIRPGCQLQMLDFTFPRIDNLRHGIDHTHELLEKVEAHLRDTDRRLKNKRVADAAQASKEASDG